MKITHVQWLLVVITTLVYQGSYAVSAELDAEEKTPAPSNSAGKEAHGLWAKRFSAAEPAADSDIPLENEPANQGAHGIFKRANWTTISSNSMLSSSSSMRAATDLSGHGDYDSCGCCSDPLWCHRCGAFADLLYLRPGNIDYIYAVEQTGTLPTDSPTGPVGRVGFDGAPGYRFGFNYALSDCSSIQASYTWFQDGTSSTINATPGTVLIFQPGLPSIPNVGASSIQASSQYDIRFQQIDLDYRGLLYGTCNSAVNYFAGLRYANLDQRFSAQENIGVPVGLSTVRSEINFDGFGIGFGLDGMRRSDCCGLLIYSRASSSFVSGEFKADFRQTAQFGPNNALGNTLVDYRVLTILQAELGLGWQDSCGRFRVTAGYMFAGWFNSLTTGSYIPGVQARQFNDLNETITFDGLVTRVMWQF